MTEYNLELERALKQRPVPGRQVEVSVERILMKNMKRKPWLQQIAVGIAACVVVITAIGIQATHHEKETLLPSGDEMKHTGLGEVQADDKLDEELTHLDWKAILNGRILIPGMELLHHESLVENREVAFIVMDVGDPYPFKLVTVVLMKDSKGTYTVGQTLASTPLENGKSFEQQAGNDWITYHWGTINREDGNQDRFAYGYIMNDRVAEVRLSNETGQQNSALILSDSKGHRFWFTTLTDHLGEGLFVVEAFHREGTKFFRTDSEGRLTESWKYNAIDLTFNEWRELSKGKSVDPNIEILKNEEKPDGSLSLFAIYYDRNFPVTGYSMASVNRAGTLTVYASLEGEEGAPFYKGNPYFYHRWRVIHSEQETQEEVQIFGLIRNPNVAAIRLTNHHGEQQMLGLMSNQVGDTFFFQPIDNDWVDFNQDIYIEALDENGEVLYAEEEVAWYY